MLNFKFKKEFKKINDLAYELEKNIRYGGSIEEENPRALKISKMIEDLYKKLNFKQKNKLYRVYCTLNQCAFRFECLKKNFFIHLLINHHEYQRVWSPYVETMLLMYSYRVFNVPFLKPLADIYLNSRTYDPNDIVHKLLLEDIISAHNGEELRDCFIDNSYDEKKASSLIKFLEQPLNEYLNGQPLLISKAAKDNYEEMIKTQNYQHYINNKEFDYVIKTDSKTKFKITKNPTFHYTYYGSDLTYTMKDRNNKSFELIVEGLIKYPSSINLLNYIIKVICGETHYTYLNNHIENIFNNITVSINDYPEYTDDQLVKILIKFFMIRVGINCNLSKQKAYEYLTMNLTTLVKSPNILEKILLSLPKKVQALLSTYCNDVSHSEEYKKLYLKLNPLYLNSKELKIYLDSSSNENIYKTLTNLKENNDLIFNHVYESYKEIYDNEHEKYLKDLEEQKLKEAEAEKQRLIEEEKQRKIEEENKKLLEQREQLKKSIEKDESRILSDQELEELVSKVDDKAAMIKVARHYFDLANSNYDYYKLAHKYYLIAGTLGNNYGHLNAAISLHNLALKYQKESAEWKDLYKKIFETLEAGPKTTYAFFAYCVYSIDYQLETNSKYIEDTYNELKDKVNDITVKFINAGYYFYKKDYNYSIVNFNEIRDYTDESIISQYVNKFANQFEEEHRKVKNPYENNHDPMVYLNPYAKGHHELHQQIAHYETVVQIAVKVRDLLDWACGLNEHRAIKSKAYYLYYGLLGYKKDHEESLRLFHKVRHTFDINDKSYKDIYNKLLEEFGKKVKKIIGE